MGKMTSLPFQKSGFDFLNSTVQLLKGVALSYDIENFQTQHRWKDLSMAFQQ